jgi:hypothetical protein
MGKVILDISMSLDGCITGPDDDTENPLGRGGQRLHHWHARKTSGNAVLPL